MLDFQEITWQNFGLTTTVLGKPAIHPGFAEQAGASIIYCLALRENDYDLQSRHTSKLLPPIASQCSSNKDQRKGKHCAGQDCFCCLPFAYLCATVP